MLVILINKGGILLQKWHIDELIDKHTM